MSKAINARRRKRNTPIDNLDIVPASDGEETAVDMELADRVSRSGKVVGCWCG
jgi:hypothetical protein